jgi:hypothetical protein
MRTIICRMGVFSATHTAIAKLCCTFSNLESDDKTKLYLVKNQKVITKSGDPINDCIFRYVCSGLCRLVKGA